MLWVLLAPICLLSCSDNLDDYEPAVWLKGNAWQALEEDGNYTMFLHAVGETGYRPMLQGKSLLTVMAPNDEAFKNYLQKKGYASIDNVDANELKKLVTFHLLYYSYDKPDLINFRPAGDSESDEESQVQAGQYYKFRTKSSDAPTKEFDNIYNTERTVYHFERFLPVFSYMYFNTKGIDAATNYEYFYPDSKWTGSDGFNVSDATVDEYDIVVDNGRIYKIDRVLEPLETVDVELTNNEDYSDFIGLYNRYSTYDYDADISKSYAASAGVDSLFLHNHGSLQPIAQEWLNQKNVISTVGVMSNGVSVFAPNNSAMRKFFSNYWQPGGYSSLEDVDENIMKAFLSACTASKTVFPEELSNGTFYDKNTSNITFELSDVGMKKMCVNGVIYGLNKFTTPPIFNSVVGKSYSDVKYKEFMYALSTSGLGNSFTTKENKYVVMLPSTALFTQKNYWIKKYTDGNALSKPNPDDPESPSKLSSTECQDIVNVHTISGIDALPSSGCEVLTTQAAYNYLFIQNGTVTSSARFTNSIISESENKINPFGSFTLADGNGFNGRAYSYEATEGLFEPMGTEVTKSLEESLATVQNIKYPYFYFGKLLQLAGMTSDRTLTNVYIGGKEKVARFVVFIPTANALNAALAAGKVPGVTGKFNGEDYSGITVTDKEALQSYLKTYFILSDKNAITVYPYPGSKFSTGTYKTDGNANLDFRDLGGSSLTVGQIGSSHRVSLVSGTQFTSYPFPVVFGDGCIQFIDNIL